MKKAIVISTFGSPAYIALQIESARRFSPDSSILIYDDMSNNIGLRDLCKQQRIELYSNHSRMGHFLGDLNSYIVGLEFAKNIGAEQLIKISRRFLPITSWENIPFDTTVGNSDVAFNWNLRTEFVGFNVEMWHKQLSLKDYAGGFIENHIAEKAQKIGSITQFDWLGATRYRDNGNFLWYNFATPLDYVNKGLEWGLEFTESDFNTSPNWEQ